MILGEIHEVSEKTLKLIDEMEGYFGKGIQIMNITKKFVIFMMKTIKLSIKLTFMSLIWTIVEMFLLLKMISNHTIMWNT